MVLEELKLLLNGNAMQRTECDRNIITQAHSQVNLKYSQLLLQYCLLIVLFISCTEGILSNKDGIHEG